MIFSRLNQLNQAFKASLKDSWRIMALDVGTKRIGVALSDETRLIATPKLVLNRKSNLKDFAEIAKILRENNVKAIVVGMPINMDKSASVMSEFVEKFCAELDGFLEGKIPIILFDERLTSFEAREIAASELSRKKEFYDDIAAALILEHFLLELGQNLE